MSIYHRSENGRSISLHHVSAKMVCRATDKTVSWEISQAIELSSVSETHHWVWRPPQVGGRLANAALSSSQQHPVTLHGKDPLTTLFTRSLHISLLHAGPTLLMSSVGAVLHIIGAKRLIRSICRSCVTCKKVTATTQHQMMGQLPQQ